MIKHVADVAVCLLCCWDEGGHIRACVMHDLSFLLAHMQTYKAHPSTCTHTLRECHRSVSLWLREMASFLTIISCIMSQIWTPCSPTVLPWILIPHSDWFISETPRQIMPLINRNDASIPTSFFPFLRNLQGLMRNACGNRNTIKAEKLPRKRVQTMAISDVAFDYTAARNSPSFLLRYKSAE